MTRESDELLIILLDLEFVDGFYFIEKNIVGVGWILVVIGLLLVLSYVLVEFLVVRIILARVV